MLVNMIVLETTTYVVKNALEKILVSTNVMGNLQNAGMQLTTEKIQKKRGKIMKYKLFTHTDRDGVGCAILAYLAFGRENVDVEYCNYNDVNEKVSDFLIYGTPGEYNAVFITDISINNELAMAIDKYTVEDLWHLFDHHATAIYLNGYDWCQVLIESPVTHIKTSGTELFFDYLRANKYLDKFQGTRLLTNIIKFVQNVRDYDTWRWKEIGEEGIICTQVNDLFYIYGRDKFIDWTLNYFYNNLSPLHSFPYFSEADQLLLDNKQKDIDRYVEEKDKSLISMRDKNNRWFGLVFADRYISELGNRLCEMNPGLEYVAIVNISTGQVSYRTISDDINLGTEVAHAYGGGGHPKAAGSTFCINNAIQNLIGFIFHIDSDNYKGNE